MIELTGTVYYKDGRVVTYEGGAPALAAWDEYALRHQIPYLSANLNGGPGYLFALVMLHSLSETEEGFEVWRRSVKNVDFELTEVPPTRPDPGEEPSSSLPTFSGSPPTRSDGFHPATSPRS